jgi:hypothetical protein
MKTDGRVKLYLQSFLTSAPDGVKWSRSRAGHITHAGKPLVTTRRLEGTGELVWSLGWEENLSGIDPRFLGRPARSLATVPTLLSRLAVVEKH